MGNFSEVVVFLISFCEPCKGMALVIRSLCSTFHTFTLLWIVCLWHAQEGRDGNTLAATSTNLSLTVSLTCVCMCVCVHTMRNYGRPNLTLWEV